MAYLLLPCFLMSCNQLNTWSAGKEVDSCLCLVPLQVLLLDEVTVDLDVVTRLDFLDFLKEGCNEVNFLSLFVVIMCHQTSRMKSDVSSKLEVFRKIVTFEAYHKCPNFHLVFNMTLKETLLQSSIAERSYHCLCYTHIWWPWDMGNSSRVHPRWWIEEGRGVNTDRWTEVLREPPLHRRILVASGNKVQEREANKSSYPIPEDIPLRFLSFCLVQAYGILPLSFTRKRKPKNTTVVYCLLGGSRSPQCILQCCGWYS